MLRRELVAVDIGGRRAVRLPTFETTRLLDGSPLRRYSDTSTKRNLGLALARMVGWERIVFLDDDIRVPHAADLTDAVNLLDSYDGVGLAIGGCPDKLVNH